MATAWGLRTKPAGGRSEKQGQSPCATVLTVPGKNIWNIVLLCDIHTKKGHFGVLQAKSVVSFERCLQATSTPAPYH